MAYKTLYRVYRPQKFEDVAGQEHIIKTLIHAVEENKIAHAYLFCGPRGTGKTTIAKLLAKAINCTSSHKPCDECENCKEITLGNHPDVIEIDAASNNGVEEVRNLIEKVKYAPTSAKYKVYIIDEVHMMSTGAFNALLKTLEEPPAHVVFILATTEPHKILPTIISRCQRFDFSKITIDDIIYRMKTVVKEENYLCDDEALELIARLADGGMRDALSILEQCLAYNDQHLTVDDVNHIYGILSLDKKIDLLKVLLTKNMKKSLELLEQMKSTGIDIKRLTLDIVDILKDVIIYKNTNEISLLFVLSKTYIDSLVPYISCDEAFEFIDILMDASEKYAKVINPFIYFELAILKICNHVKEEKVIEVIKEVVKEDEKIEVIEEVIDEDIPTFEFEQEEEVEEQVDDETKVDTDDIINIMVQAQKPLLESIQERWYVVKRYLSNLNMAKSASMLVTGTPVVACPGGLVIAFEFDAEVNNVNYYKNYKQLSHFISNILGEEYRFVAMTNRDFQELRQKFIVLMRNKQLPQPHEITLRHIDGKDLDEEDESEALKYAKNLFGDIVEYKED